MRSHQFVHRVSRKAQNSEASNILVSMVECWAKNVVVDFKNCAWNGGDRRSSWRVNHHLVLPPNYPAICIFFFFEKFAGRKFRSYLLTYSFIHSVGIC